MEIKYKYMIISAFITMFILYLINPNPRVIIRMPDPKNETSDMYVDENGIYYKYHRKRID